MFRIVLGIGLLVSALANRIQSHRANSDDVHLRAKFGATCENLQATFQHRVEGLQTLLDAHPDGATLSTATRARFTMRTLQVARVLRRARTCSWVVDGNSDDIEQMRGIVQTMLAGNPCAQAARAELEAGSSDDDSTIEMTAVRRALSILASENCEVTLSPEEDAPSMDLDDDEELEAQIGMAEEQAQERADELMDAFMDEEGNGAFVETSFDSHQVYGGIFRTLGVVFLFILLLLACTSALAFIGGFIMSIYAEMACAGVGGFCGIGEVLLGLMVGGGLGLAGCAYQLTTQLLPRLAVDQ